MDRWEAFKPTIEKLYLQERRKLADVVTIMKRDHGFDAVEHQYKHHFKKWKWSKNIPKSKKVEIAEQLESRARAGKRAPIVRFQGRVAETHKIRRHMKEKIRTESRAISLQRPNATAPVLQFANSIFLKWNLPYAALRHLHVRPFDHASPLGFSIPTPGSNISVDTPSSAASPPNAPSPTAIFVKRKTAVERAHLFAQGQLDALNTSMNGEERRVMSDWLYQYWLFCFTTTKNWGRGPRAWTAEMLGFRSYQSQPPASLPGTPHDSMQYHVEQEEMRTPLPTNLCRWAIHLNPEDVEFYYSSTDEDSIQDPVDQDPKDESTWAPWPSEWEEPPLPARLRNALEHNDFSTVPTAALPVAIPEISKAAQRSPDELLFEAFGFSIMSRNLNQVVTRLREIKERKLECTSLYPLHLATSYLDGYKSCCEILTALLGISDGASLRAMYTNEMGHTILDNLMISILRSHSSSKPVVVDNAFKDTLRFAGEEVDICGRWDADSPCVRGLLERGNPSTPFSWKHKFCHTSAQAVCHCVIQIKRNLPNQLVNAASGLFVRRCFNCGEKLELSPLHTLVMTAYHLANSACEDEDLFGMLALLLCFISLGMDALATANISITALLDHENSDLVCNHEQLTAAELAARVSAHHTLSSWSTSTRMGWDVFCGVLCLCENHHADSGSDEDAGDDSDNEVDVIIGKMNIHLSQVHWEFHDNSENGFSHRRDLASLWASVQAELLSYRRLESPMSWTSPNFSMEELYKQLQNHELLSTGYMRKGLLEPHCVCGQFVDDTLALLSDATDPAIANLDIWERATYIPLLQEW